MENKIVQLTNVVPALIKNTRFTVNLQGWPAAITVIAICGSCVAIYALRVTHAEASYITEGIGTAQNTA